MATADDYAAWIVKNADKKGTPVFDTVAKAYQLAKTADQPQEVIDPSQGGGSLSIGPWDTGIQTPQWLDRTLSGFGKAYADTGRRVQQLATLNGNQASIDEAKMRDAPLMNTGAGVFGNILGNVSQILAGGATARVVGGAAEVPALVNAGRALVAPQSIPGALAGGAITGAVTQPVGTGDSSLKNIGEGALGSAAFPLFGAAGGLAKDLIAPFTKGGQEAIAGKALSRFATDPAAIANAPGAPRYIPGSNPNLAEATGDPGLAQFVRALRNNPDANVPLTQLDQTNRAARIGALQDIAGNPADRQAWVDARQAVTGPLYDQAFSATPTATPWITGVVTQLQKRPAFNEALQQAQTLALNDGMKLDPSNTVQVLHYTKMALDDMIGQAQGNQQRALIGTKSLVLKLMESKDFSPAYSQARTEFANMSKPINQIDVGQQLLNKFQPALADFGADTRTTAATYANALRNADQTAQQATGFPGAKMADILGPGQMRTVQGIADDLGRSAKAQELGMARGSPTMQNFAANDILRGVLGPFGLPQNWVEAALPQQVMRGAKLAYSVPDKRVLGLLGDAAADPQLAAQLFAKQLAQQQPGLISQLLPYMSAPSTAGLLGFSK